MTAILGISAFYHDSAAALVVDGAIVAAAQEERFTRKKHDAAFPVRAVLYCLEEAGLEPADLDHVVYYEQPWLKFHRLLETYLAFAPAGLESFRRAMPEWLLKKLFLRRHIRRGLPGLGGTPVHFVCHHQSHAASAFYPSPYDEAAVLTLDGVGEWTTMAIGAGEGNRLRLTRKLSFPHSLGLLYSAFTAYCGLKVNSGEYKLMGLAPYGRPVYVDLIYRHLIDVKADGSFRMDMRFFNYCQGQTMTNGRFHELFGGPPRRPEEGIEQRHMDLAASIQVVTESIVLRAACEAHRSSQKKNLVLAGGVALNCVANGNLLRQGPFESVWVQPAAGDAGGALGAALFYWYQTLRHPRTTDGRDCMNGSLLGPGFDSPTVRNVLEASAVPYDHMLDEWQLGNHVADMLAEEKVVGWFQGRMEYGPRALGARSILGDPRSPRMQATMNLKIKFRESFRPFAPAVLEEYAADWFDLGIARSSPYMLFVFPVRKEHHIPIADDMRWVMEHDPDLRCRVAVPRSVIPAVTHVDYSARVQTVNAAGNRRFHALLRAFHRRTGCPLLVNTSFNVRGEPIVCTPWDAYRCFCATGMDALVMEDCVIRKDRLAAGTSHAGAKHLSAFEPD